MNVFDQLVKLSTYVVGLTTLSVMTLTAMVIINPTLALPPGGHTNEGVVAGAYTEALPTLPPSSTSTPTPTPVPVAEPAHISVPSVNIEADIEPVGITADNTMDIPLNTNMVGWYTKSVKPGENGKIAAILNGHFDTSAGKPAIFYNLEKVQPGEVIVVTASDGLQYTYTIEHVESYPLDSFPKNLVYGEVDGTVLKLITCDGIWDTEKKLYSKRLVVTAKIKLS